MYCFMKQNNKLHATKRQQDDIKLKLKEDKTEDSGYNNYFIYIKYGKYERTRKIIGYERSTKTSGVNFATKTLKKLNISDQKKINF